MNRVLILLITFTFLSCEKDNNDVFKINNNSLKHAELSFKLEEPDIILNELAKGELDRNIHSVLKEMFDEFPEPAERYWEFDYLSNSDQVSEMRYFQTSQITTYKFYYNGKREIDSIVSNKLGDYPKRHYTFNYNDNGLLKSIYMDSEYSIEENYFGYYPNGKIKEIYNDFRSRGDKPSFNVQKLYYDLTFTNIVKVEHIGSSNYHYTYKYFYDTNKNPYKNFFVAVSVFLPHIGSAYISKNNVIKMIEKNQNNIYGNEFSYEYLFNFSNSGELETYSDKDENKLPYILYTVNQ